MSIRENVAQIMQRIQRACEKTGRDPNEIEIIAVSKTVNAAHIKEAVESGISNIGENRVQEAWQKYQELGPIACWHMVGRLQTNKVKRALQVFDIVHSVESIHLAEEIQKRAEQINREVEVLIEVNTSSEGTKIGVHPEKTLELIRQIASLPRLKIRGLMTIGVFTPDPEVVRPCFKTLHQLRDDIREEGIDGVRMEHLSMGMTDDFEVAIEEGSNMVRIGRAIFGQRPG